jgi:hypothetical protein
MSLPRMSTRLRLIILWLYEENNKLQDLKNIFTLHIPPWAPHTYDFVVITSLTHPRKIILVVKKIGKAKDLSAPLRNSRLLRAVWTEPNVSGSRRVSFRCTELTFTWLRDDPVHIKLRVTVRCPKAATWELVAFFPIRTMASLLHFTAFRSGCSFFVSFCLSLYDAPSIKPIKRQMEGRLMHD